MPKRAALLLDRLMIALQKAVENDILSDETSGSSYSRKDSPGRDRNLIYYPDANYDYMSTKTVIQISTIIIFYY